jgi:hypothetical protein
MKGTHTAFTAIAALLLFLPFSASARVKYKVLHSFGSGSDGTEPSGPLAPDGKGNLFGVTYGGGTGCTGGCGTVFELTPAPDGHWKESILHAFTGGGGGSLPQGILAFDNAGNLYGAIGGYGSFAVGGVFQLSPAASPGWNFDVLYSGGAGPGLIIDDLGNLYGRIGNNKVGAGVLGELSPGSEGWAYSALYSLCSQQSCADGDIPTVPPTWDGKGNMFGTTTWGGISNAPCQARDGCGVIYEMTPGGDGTWIYNVLHRFASFKNDGQNPYSGLVMDKSGNFYGGTWAGGRYELGTVFKLAYIGGRWKETILYHFPDCNHGCGVDGTLAMDKHGNLYGTAAGGPPKGCYGLTCGVVFKLSPQKNGKWKYNVVYNLTEKGGGSAPFYGVIPDDKGNLFGVTSQFGKYDFGTAFEITQ